MRKPLLLLSAVVVLFVGVILARTARYGSVPPSVEPAAEVAIPKRAAERLAGSLRFPPISSEDPAAFDAEPFRGLQADTPRCHPARVRSEILSTAVARLEENQMPARLEGPTRQLFDRVGPLFPFAQRAVFANLWLTRPLVMRTLEESPATNAMVRTTTAPTILQAGTKDNVLPSDARTVINFRILPGDTVAGVNVFRFLPLRLTSRDLERMHGTDERIGIREYEGAIRTYRQLVLEAAGS